VLKIKSFITLTPGVPAASDQRARRQAFHLKAVGGKKQQWVRLKNKPGSTTARITLM
jgi:CRISPR/Cas system CSM-associated protein Csm4 (group 5 of RAMP superfamily)